MSIDTTFKPLTETYFVDNSAAVQIPGANQRGVTTFRIRNSSAGGTTAYIAWGPKAAGLAAVAPTLGAPSPNTIGISGNITVNIEVPCNSFFIGSSATNTFEITGGTGGTGA